MSKVIVEKREDMWIVRINAPERRNALGREVVQGLLDAAEAVANEKAVRCVILMGSGDKAFCAGADLKERKGMPEDQVREFVSLLNRMMNTIATSPIFFCTTFFEDRRLLWGRKMLLCQTKKCR